MVWQCGNQVHSLRNTRSSGLWLSRNIPQIEDSETSQKVFILGLKKESPIPVGFALLLHSACFPESVNFVGLNRVP